MYVLYRIYTMNTIYDRYLQYFKVRTTFHLIDSSLHTMLNIYLFLIYQKTSNSLYSKYMLTTFFYCRGSQTSSTRGLASRK